MDYPKHMYIYFRCFQTTREPESEVPSIPFDVQLSSDLYANVGLHTWPKYTQLQVFAKIETLDTIHSTVYNRVTKFCYINLS